MWSKILLEQKEEIKEITAEEKIKELEDKVS